MGPSGKDIPSSTGRSEHRGAVQLPAPAGAVAIYWCRFTPPAPTGHNFNNLMYLLGTLLATGNVDINVPSKEELEPENRGQTCNQTVASQ